MNSFLLNEGVELIETIGQAIDHSTDLLFFNEADLLARF